MRVVLIDTNIVSILFKLENARYEKCVTEIGDRQCYISFMTRGELLLWPKVNRWGDARRSQLFQHITEYTTLFPDDETCAIWADVMAESRRAVGT